MSDLLPAGFEALEPFVADWCLPDSLARMAKRRASSMDDIKAFYDVAIAQADRALKYLRAFPLGAVPPAEERLLKLMLSLAEVGPAVEWFDSPHVYDGFDATKIRYTRLIPDSAAQA
ncbi:MAG: hypothetical protein AB7F98_07510 [Novosphingobium sp.]